MIFPEYQDEYVAVPPAGEWLYSNVAGQALKRSLQIFRYSIDAVQQRDYRKIKVEEFNDCLESYFSMLKDATSKKMGSSATQDQAYSSKNRLEQKMDFTLSSLLSKSKS